MWLCFHYNRNIKKWCRDDGGGDCPTKINVPPQRPIIRQWSANKNSSGWSQESTYETSGAQESKTPGSKNKQREGRAASVLPCTIPFPRRQCSVQRGNFQLERVPLARRERVGGTTGFSSLSGTTWKTCFSFISAETRGAETSDN